MLSVEQSKLVAVTNDHLQKKLEHIVYVTIESIIWRGDNKTQRNTARECIHAHRYTHRGKRKDVLQCCWQTVHE